jgi:hypothetical protein
MIEPVKREIDGDEYQFLPLQAKAARRELDGLLQAFGPSVSKGIRGLKAANVDAELTTDNVVGMLPAIAEAIGGAVEGFTRALTPEYHEKIVKTFLDRCTIKRYDEARDQERWPTLDEKFREIHFGTRLLTETKILLFCLEVQYADFFELLGNLGTSLGRLLPDRTQSSSESREGSTGGSTG